MDADENDLIPVKDMNDKEKYSRSMFHEREASAVHERAGISKLSREELEDRHLRLLEENQILKKHCHKQEDKIKRLATKLLRLVQDRKKTGESAARQRDPETAELIQSQQDQINQMERQIAQLKDKLLVARQQVNTSQGRPGRAATRPDPFRKPSSRPSSKTSSQLKRPAAPAAVEPQQLPPYAEQLLLEAREAAARLQQQSAALAERNRQLDDSFSTLREQCNMYEQELEMLKEQSRVKELEHEEEMEVLRNQANQASRSKLAENVEMIKLQRELKQTASRLTALQTHAQGLEEALKTERPAYERAAREIAELTRLYEEEQARCQQLQKDAAALAETKQKLDELETALRDAQRENDLLRTANEKLSEIGSDQDWQREQQATLSSLRAQLASVESSLRAEQGRRRQLADQLTAEQQRSWRLQAEARDLQSQLMMRPAPVAPPPPPPAVQPPPPPPPVPQPRAKPETCDKSVCTSPRRRESVVPAERSESRRPSPRTTVGTPTSELLSKIDTGEPVDRQLASLHCQYVDTVQELEKTRTLLDVQKQINASQQQEVELLSRRLAELGRAREKAEAELRAALQARTNRIRQLENKLREVVYRAPGTGLPRPAVMDSSMQLESGYCLLELHVQQLTVTSEMRRRLGDAGVFLTWLFFNQDMHYTPVLRGDLKFACSSLYKLCLNRDLIDYLANGVVTIEVHQTKGTNDSEQLGSVAISCREILEYPRNKLHGTAGVPGVGTLSYWFRADGTRLEDFLRDQAAEDAGHRSVDASLASNGAGDQTIVAGSPDICEPPTSPKPSRGPAAVSTPVRRRLAARTPPAAAGHAAQRLTFDARPAPAPAAAGSDSEPSESEPTPERRPRRPAGRARSETDLKSAPRPAARRQAAAGAGAARTASGRAGGGGRAGAGGRGDGVEAGRAGETPAGRPRRRGSDARGEETPRRGGGDRDGARRRRGARQSEERERAALARGERTPRPAGARLVQSGPPAAGARRQEPPPPAPRRLVTTTEIQQPRGTGYATYTESSASETSSPQGTAREPPQREEGRKEPQRREAGVKQTPEKQSVGDRETPRNAASAQQVEVVGSSLSEEELGSFSDESRSPPKPADRSPLTAGRTPPSPPASGRRSADRQPVSGRRSADRPPGSARQRRHRSPPRERPPSGGGESSERRPTPPPAAPAAWSAGGASDRGSSGSEERSPERTVVAAAEPRLRVAADVHRRLSAAPPGSPSTGTGTDSDGVVLHHAHGTQPSASDAVTVTVHRVTLRAEAEVYAVAGPRPRLFVEFRFLDIPPEELESPHSLPLAEPGQPLVFNFRKVISVSRAGHRSRRQQLASLLRPDSSERGLVTFTVVAEPPDSADESAECVDVGYAHVSLPEVLSSGRDLAEARLPLSAASGDPVGQLTVSLQALQALRAASGRTDA